MKVLIDADACPVIEIAVQLCLAKHIPCTLFCDTAHEFHLDGVSTVIVAKGADSTDFAIANRAAAGDIVITQDYGLASMCLARGATVLHQDGWEYTQDNIDALLLARHESRKYRAAGGRTKGPRKRTAAQDRAFSAALREKLGLYTDTP
ncbi:MAG: YaiI/YqxD family protein [Oscillospiraceae bacterium]|nr:YaiI/YqxD family protein [Oscillospiraceae bacterium]